MINHFKKRSWVSQRITEGIKKTGSLFLHQLDIVARGFLIRVLPGTVLEANCEEIDYAENSRSGFSQIYFVNRFRNALVGQTEIHRCITPRAFFTPCFNLLVCRKNQWKGIMTRVYRFRVLTRVVLLEEIYILNMHSRTNDICLSIAVIFFEHVELRRKKKDLFSNN